MTIKHSLTPVDEALRFLTDRATPVSDAESIPVLQALGRVLAQPVVSRVNVPPLDNSAMDGYAINTDDLAAGHTTLPVSQRIPAGVTGEPLKKGSAARIFTGAPVPPGADAVVMQENTSAEGDEVTILKNPEPGQNIRRAGEDIGEGDTIMSAGRHVRAQEMGLAASVGVAELTVYRRVRVALFMTGDELVEPGTPLQPGQIYNSNRYTLSGQLQAMGCKVIDSGIVPDDFDATVAALQKAADSADLVISTGGVSVGEEDYVKLAIKKLGEMKLWKIAVKPGKPLAFGDIGGTPLIGLPGNPVSSFVTFVLFARPFIRKMQGLEPGGLDGYPVKAGFDRKKAGTRREFFRARLVHTECGPHAVLYLHQGSGVLSSVSWAEGLVDIAAGQSVNKGDTVSWIPFAELEQ